MLTRKKMIAFGVAAVGASLLATAPAEAGRRTGHWKHSPEEIAASQRTQEEAAAYRRWRDRQAYRPRWNDEGPRYRRWGDEY